MNQDPNQDPDDIQHSGQGTLVVVIPFGMKFSDLKLHTMPGDDGMIGMDTDAILAVLLASKICPNCFFQDQAMRSMLLTLWYDSHLSMGGPTDPVMEALRLAAEAKEDQETAFERAAQGKFIHPAGNA